MQLSETSQKLLTALQATGGGWIDSFTKTIFNKPIYPLDRDPEKLRDFWQWEADIYNTTDERPIGNNFETFVGVQNYSNQISKAYQELRKLGLAGEKNNGYNEHWIYPKTKRTF